MNFLNVQVIINGKEIYTLPKEQPVLVAMSKNVVSLVATDGFHVTQPLELEYPGPKTYRLKVVCAIDDNLLLTGALLLLILFFVGIISDIFIFRLLSFGPILYFLFFYYLNRKTFLQIKAG